MTAPAARADPAFDKLAAVRLYEMRAAAAALAPVRMGLIARLFLRFLGGRDGWGRRRFRHRRRRRRDHRGGSGGRGGPRSSRAPSPGQNPNARRPPPPARNPPHSPPRARLLLRPRRPPPPLV